LSAAYTLALEPEAFTYALDGRKDNNAKIGIDAVPVCVRAVRAESITASHAHLP
jgi:hypothetical protein